MFKKLALIPLLLSSAAFAEPNIVMSEAAQDKINLILNFNNANKVTYFETKNEMIGVSVVNENSFRKELFYTNDEADFIIKGLMIDTKSHENLTQGHYQSIKLPNVVEEDIQDFVKASGITQGTGDNEVIAFIDVNCPACHQAWKQYQEVLDDENSNLKVTWVPLAWLGQDSKFKAQMLLGEAKEKQLALLKSYMSKAPLLPENDKMNAGKSLVEANGFILKARRIQGVPFVLAKVNNKWSVSPGIPSRDHFASLKPKPLPNNKTVKSDNSSQLNSPR